MATAWADGLLRLDRTLLDYGCGRGDDLRLLTSNGFRVRGWDPAYRPDSSSLEPADVVNLGYVVNVIENPKERAETLQKAWALARQVLVISARLVWEVRDLQARHHADGLLTRTGTFQKFYEQSELSSWIAATLGSQPVAAAPGVFYVFRDVADAQRFLSDRVHTYRPRITLDPHALYELHEPALQPLVRFMTAHLRPPGAGELADGELAGLVSAFGSLTAAARTVRSALTADFWQQAERQRRSEILIYVALSRFQGRPTFRELGETLRRDIRAVFTGYRVVCAQADRLLLAVGDPVRTYMTARASSIGKQTPSALYVHRSAMSRLAPLLQVYEGCARVLAGAVDGSNMIKLSVEKPQVSYLTYPRFDRDAHPTLHSSVTVNLDRLSVDLRDYAGSSNPPLLHRKEEFIARDHPRRELYEKLTRAEVRAGLYANPGNIGTLKGWEATLEQAGRLVRGHRLTARDVAPYPKSFNQTGGFEVMEDGSATNSS